MSEELEQNDGTWSGLKKTIIGTISTIVLGAGTWVGTTLFGGDKEEAAPAPQAAPVINLNLQNNNTQTQSSGGGTKVIERVVEKPAQKVEEKPKKKKEGDEFKEKEPQW